MALKIKEVGGKLLLEGNINSVTEVFLKQHILTIKDYVSTYRIANKRQVKMHHEIEFKKDCARLIKK